MKSRTTGRATSASSRAMRTSRSMSVHIGFGDAGLAAHFLDEAGEFVGKGGGHERVFRLERNGSGRNADLATAQNAKL